MDMGALDLYFNIISLAAGSYFLYTWWRLKKERKLFVNQLLMSKDSKPEECLDEAEYVGFIRPWLLVAGLILAIVGAVCLLDSFVGLVEDSYRLNQVGTLLCIVAVFGYIIVWTKGRKRYW